MGIRYYAWPLHPDLVDLARSYPEAFAADDPFGDAWSTENTGNCYLDKAWPELQCGLRGSVGLGRRQRPAFSLVEGDVVMTNEGWIAHFGVLDPVQLLRAARDLQQIPVFEPSRRPRREPARSRRGAAMSSGWVDQDYAGHYLEVLRNFVGALAQAKMGMIYMIG